MKSRALLCVGSLVSFTQLMIPIGVVAQTIVAGDLQNHQLTAFDVPGAGSAAGQGTFAIGINALGVISGYYIDSNSVSHGFLRGPEGTLTTFDPPGAASQAGGGTTVLGLNLQGATAGYFADANFAFHSFLREPNGKFTTFDSPGACTTSVSVGCHGTGAYNINDFGVIAGAYEDTSGNFVAHTFLRHRDGTFTTFVVPGSPLLAGLGTLPTAFSGLSQSGAVTGVYIDTNFISHGFLREANGAFTTFDAPGAVYGTSPTGLNDSGAITGYYLDTNLVFHGFLRGERGTFATFDAPGADQTAGNFNGTFASNVNSFGVIIGNFTDSNGVNHGFVRGRYGQLTTFDAAGAGTAAGQGTIPTTNNWAGATTGYLIDGAGVAHGFVRP